MAIRNRLFSLIYRIIELVLGVYVLVFLFLSDKTDANVFQSFLYFSTEAMFLMVAIVFCEVICNFVDLLKNGKDGLAAGVYMPLTLMGLTMIISDCLVYNISSPFLGGYALGQELFSVLLAHIFMPIIFFLDYLLFDEKGTVKWKHVVIWLIYPLAYFTLIMVAHYIFKNNIYPYPFLNPNALATSSEEILSGNHGWNGSLIIISLMMLGFLILGSFMVFLNNLLAHKYKRRIR